MSMLESRTRFTHVNERKQRPISIDGASTWTSGQMYRTSYRDMSVKAPNGRKSDVVPGYQGYIPGMKAGHELGLTIGNIANKCLREQETMRQTVPTFSTITYKPGQEDKRDLVPTQNHKYGKQTIPPPSKMSGAKWSTTFRQSYHKQAISYGNMDRYLSQSKGSGFSKSQNQFKLDPKVKQAWRDVAKESGYVQNSTLFDGSRWVPEKNLHTDQMRSEYRIRYNRPKPFQHATRYGPARGASAFDWKQGASQFGDQQKSINTMTYV